ncbi:unnamed protein product, partial [Polarella glacialis]
LGSPRNPVGSRRVVETGRLSSPVRRPALETQTTRSRSGSRLPEKSCDATSAAAFLVSQHLAGSPRSYRGDAKPTGGARAGGKSTSVGRSTLASPTRKSAAAVAAAASAAAGLTGLRSSPSLAAAPSGLRSSPRPASPTRRSAAVVAAAATAAAPSGVQSSPRLASPTRRSAAAAATPPGLRTSPRGHSADARSRLESSLSRLAPPSSGRGSHTLSRATRSPGRSPGATGGSRRTGPSVLEGPGGLLAMLDRLTPPATLTSSPSRQRMLASVAERVAAGPEFSPRDWAGCLRSGQQDRARMPQSAVQACAACHQPRASTPGAALQMAPQAGRPLFGPRCAGRRLRPCAARRLATGHRRLRQGTPCAAPPATYRRITPLVGHGCRQRRRAYWAGPRLRGGWHRVSDTQFLGCFVF